MKTWKSLMVGAALGAAAAAAVMNTDGIRHEYTYTDAYMGTRHCIRRDRITGASWTRHEGMVGVGNWRKLE